MGKLALKNWKELPSKQGSRTGSAYQYKNANYNSIGQLKIYQVDLKKMAETDQDLWLNRLIAAQAEQGNTTKEKMLKRHKRHEAQRNLSRKVKYLRGRLRSRGVTFCIVEQPANTFTEVSDKEKMEKALAAIHKNKYSQCEGTPMMTPLLRYDFGYLGVDQSASKQVLDGTYVPPQGSDKYATSFLKEMAMSDIAAVAKEQPEGIPVEVWKRFWKKAKERMQVGLPPSISGSLKQEPIVT